MCVQDLIYQFLHWRKLMTANPLYLTRRNTMRVLRTSSTTMRRLSHLNRPQFFGSLIVPLIIFAYARLRFCFTLLVRKHEGGRTTTIFVIDLVVAAVASAGCAAWFESSSDGGTMKVGGWTRLRRRRLAQRSPFSGEVAKARKLPRGRKGASVSTPFILGDGKMPSRKLGKNYSNSARP